MKYLQLICLFALLCLTACKDGKNAADAQNKPAPSAVAPGLENDKAPDMHNSENALDWPGKYSGVLPCWEGCDGYKHVIELHNDNSYVLWLQQLGQEKQPREIKGSFTWNEEGTIITLDAEGDHLKFRVMENMLKKLDKFGNEEQGAPQARYLLRKIQ